LQANTVPQARRMRLETPAAPQTTTLSCPFSVKYKLHRLKRGQGKSNVKNNDLLQL
jgi:hypothetical protein